MRTFVIIDGNAIIHRSYHAIPKTLKARDGRLTNAVYGFTRLLLGILEYEKPDFIAVAFDMKGPTFRHEMLESYKGTREKTDEELIDQFPRVREVLQAFNIPIYEKPGLEADDYLGIVSELVRRGTDDVHTLIITNDKDALQLVDERTTVVAPVKGYSEVLRYDRLQVKSKLGVWPEQVADFKGLCGDNSDNIKGVPGIGPKTAVKLLEQFGNLEHLYDHLDEVSPVTLRTKLADHQKEAENSKQVATILREDKDLNFKLSACEVHDFDMSKVREVFEHLNFNTPLRQAEGLNRAWEKKRQEEKQGQLF